MDPKFPIELETFLGLIVEFLKLNGNTPGVEVIIKSKASLEHLERDNWNGGTDIWGLNLDLDLPSYGSAKPNLKAFEEAIRNIGRDLLKEHEQDRLRYVAINTVGSLNPQWRIEAKRYLNVAEASTEDQGHPMSGALVDTSELLNCIDELEKLLHERATAKATPDQEEAYARLRRKLIMDSEAKKRLPLVVVKSSNLQAVWPYLQKFPSYRERREFASKELEPVRAWLEGRDNPDDGWPVIPDSRTFLHSLRSFLESEGQKSVAALTLGISSSFAVRKGIGRLLLRVPIERVKDFGVQEKHALLQAARRLLPSGVTWHLEKADVDPMLETPLDENEPLPGPMWKSARAMAHDGLWFRSKTEIRIYEALKKRPIFFLVNASGVLGGTTTPHGRPELREPDFLVCLDGKWGILEVMGENYHTSQTAPKDHDRARLFKQYGVMMIEFFDAHSCYNTPEKVVDKFLELLAKT
jgi:hypothetical protein